MLVIILSIILAATYICALGISSYFLLIDKGYRKHYWVGYVFGVFGLIWCAGLPDVKNRQLLKEIKSKLEENK